MKIHFKGVINFKMTGVYVITKYIFPLFDK